MTILFFARLFVPHIGGVEKHVYEISKRLIKKNHKVIIITEQFDKRLKKKELFDGIEIYRIPLQKDNWFKKFYIWNWIAKHKSIIQNADVIHCHDVFFWFLPFKMLFFNKKVFTTFHGYERYPVKKRAIVIRKISEMLSKGNICVGDFIKKWYKTKPDYVIYGGVDPIKEDKSANKNSAAFIGRLDDQTSVETYVKAFTMIKRTIKDFKLIVVGDGELKDTISKEVHVEGFQQDIIPYLQKNHFAFVSRYLSILEALYAKRLIVAVYDNPVKEDYLRMAPFAKDIVIVSSPEQIMSKVLYYLQHPEKEMKLTEEGYKWVQKQTWESIVKIYLDLWNKK